jgi:hypothetical protein
MKIKIQIEIEIDDQDVQYPVRFIEVDECEEDWRWCSKHQLIEPAKVSKNGDRWVRGNPREKIKRGPDVKPTITVKVVEGALENGFRIEGSIPGFGNVLVGSIVGV